jgi:PPM family protein phosphatase
VGSMVVSAFSHAGAVRPVNEDNFTIAAPAFLVADGMGGHARGDRASQEAVRVVRERLGGRVSVTPADVIDAVERANAAVRALSGDQDSGTAVAGTTLTGVVRVSTGEAEHWMVLNVGDSRVYGWDGRVLRQLTKDHSAVQELMDAGVIDAVQAARHPERNVITRALGADDSVDADVWMLPVSGHQTFLVCSDGLPKELPDERIAAILAGDGAAGTSGGEPPDIARRLCDAAVAAGGHDNVTAIVVESLVEEVSAETGSTQGRPGAQSYTEDTVPRGIS